MRRSLHAFRMMDVSRVVWGKKTIRGVWVGGAGDHGVFDLPSRVERSRVWGMLWVMREESRLWMLGAEWS